MDERAARAVMSGEQRGLLAGMLRAVCWGISCCYGLIVQLRNTAYDRDWLPVQRVNVPVISVGNLTAGGTGKTPVVAWLVQELQRRGYRPGIVSRGYRSLDGHVNDEALVLQQLCPGVPHEQHPRRVLAARKIVAETGCDVIVLDDGFQHRRLHRDLDLVLIDATQPWGYGYLLPRGLLREPRANLWRADLMMVTRVAPARVRETQNEFAQVLDHLKERIPVLMSTFAPCRWLAATGESLPLGELPGKRIASFCGLGNPAGFDSLLSSMMLVEASRHFPDHYHYSTADLTALEQWRVEQGLDTLVTTQKDLVKIPADHAIARHLWALQIDTQWLGEIAPLMRRLDCIIPARDCQPGMTALPERRAA